MSVVPIIERVFAVPSSNGDEKPFMLWARKARGFPEEGRATDLYTYLVNDLAAEVKDQVASVETDFQTIDIFDTAFQKKDLVNVYDKSLHRHGSHNLVPTNAARPDRIVFLDGWIQSTLFHEAAYHEALVHPGMFAHARPKRVAIIGGGECATLREVLKHNTVKEAIMIEIDEKMVNASREYLSEWSDCSDIEGSASWCVDDPRVKMYYQDALAWFVDRYSSGKESRETAEPQLDVIIMDAL
jgi:spermidine synthase